MSLDALKHAFDKFDERSYCEGTYQKTDPAVRLTQGLSCAAPPRSRASIRA